jgi:hypothetical protein
VSLVSPDVVVDPPLDVVSDVDALLSVLPVFDVVLELVAPERVAAPEVSLESVASTAAGRERATLVLPAGLETPLLVPSVLSVSASAAASASVLAPDSTLLLAPAELPAELAAEASAGEVPVAFW